MRDLLGKLIAKYDADLDALEPEKPTQKKPSEEPSEEQKSTENEEQKEDESADVEAADAVETASPALPCRVFTKQWLVGKGIHAEVLLEGFSTNIGPNDEVSLEVKEYECYVTESKPNLFTNLAFPEECRETSSPRIFNIKPRYVDRSCNLAYFIKPSGNYTSQSYAERSGNSQSTTGASGAEYNSFGVRGLRTTSQQRKGNGDKNAQSSQDNSPIDDSGENG
jgi:hypothetical protein